MSKVLVNFIQDRSGSMADAWSETLSGFQSFVKDLQEKSNGTDVQYLFSLTTFDTVVETPIIAQPIESVNLDELAKHGPRGMTALWDATGQTIKNTEDNPHGADKIVVVIVTDGKENSSREWSKERLHSVIDAKLALGNWTFTYLGTQPETWDDAGVIGVGAGASATYQPHMANAAYRATASALHSMSASRAMGSRTLLKSYVPTRAAAAAGMKINKPTFSQKPGSAPKTKPSTNKSIGRWR